MKRTVRFTLNSRKFGSQTTVEGVHVGDDNSCELIISVTDGNKILDLSSKTTVATMCGTKPDGTVISRPCSIVDNNIVYTLEKQDTAVSGNVFYQVTVVSDDGISQSIIATAKFTVAVMKNIYIPIYRVLESEPSDWPTNYTAYYRLIDNKYVAVSDSSCPAFLKDTFYYLVNPNFNSKDDYGAFQSALVRVENLIGRASDILTILDKKINDNEAEHICNKVSAVDFQNLSATDYPNIKALNNYHTNYVEPCYEDIENCYKDIENLDNNKTDKADVLSDEVNLLNITGIGAHTSSTYTYTLGENSITVTNKNDSALNLSLTLLDGKISCHGTTGDSDVTIKLNASANCNGEYMFAILNQQSQKNSYPSVCLSKESGIIAETQLYGSRDKTYRNITLSSTDIKFVLIVFTKNNTYDLSFNLSLSESTHRIPYLPFGISPKLFVEKTDYYNDTVYPHMFGAVGDGVTDDTAALQLAIDYAVANKKLLRLSGGCTYLISNTLSWSGAYIRFDGNNATIKVSDIITPFTLKSLSSVFKINNLADLDDSAQSRYILRRFGNVNIDCNCGRAVYGVYIESGGKTIYQNIMINNPEYCGLRMMGGNEAVISNVHACQTDINYDDMRDDYKNSAAIYLSTSDNYAENCVSVDFVRGFATGGTDNHFSKCHAWNAHDKDKIKNSISFDVLGGYSTFSQCTVDSTKYGYYLHKQEYSSESARACIIGGVSAYNSIYVNNYAELGSPTLFYFAPEHTLKGKAVIVVSSNFKATSGINCNFDNLTDDDNKICIDQLIPHYENDAEVFWENAHYICINDKADKATTLDGYGINDAYTKDEVDNELAAKSDLVQSKNIFDFDKWAKCLQSLSNPVFRGSLDGIDFDKKSITFTGTEAGSYTNGWINNPAEMNIVVKPNTVYTFSWQFTGSSKTQIFLFFNGVNTAETRFSKISTTGSGYLTFTTSEDTSYITIRLDNLEISTASFSEIMIEEGEQKSLYLPYEVAEGVKELARSTEARLANLENAMQDLILMTLGGE